MCVVRVPVHATGMPWYSQHNLTPKIQQLCTVDSTYSSNCWLFFYRQVEDFLLNAVVYLRAEEALNDARECDQQLARHHSNHERPISPFFGVPTVIKECMECVVGYRRSGWLALSLASSSVACMYATFHTPNPLTCKCTHITPLLRPFHHHHTRQQQVPRCAVPVSYTHLTLPTNREV